MGAITIRAKRLKEISEEEAKGLVDYRRIKVEGNSVFLERRGMAIDLGGIGKGFAIQKAYEHLRTKRGFIAIAGDLKVWGQKRLLAIYDPIGGKILAQGYNKRDLCLSTSGNCRREHIIGSGRQIIQITSLPWKTPIGGSLSKIILSLDIFFCFLTVLCI